MTNAPTTKTAFATFACFVWGIAAAWAQPNPPDNLYLEDLRGWLKSNWYDGLHDNLGYNSARSQMYGFTDILPNGNVVSGSWDFTLKVWDPSSGQCLRTLTGHAHWARRRRPVEPRL